MTPGRGLALQLFGAMAQQKVESNTLTYNAAISACEKSGEWEKALQLSRKMLQSTVDLDVATFRAAIGACEQAGANWETVRHLNDTWTWLLSGLRSAHASKPGQIGRQFAT
eukprot:TRINITY_DN9105_c0_g1_i5.p1 TRINITY_DN9105_c0_g1~~TRINITY_DN9105_c0_g1_i5.p1  ORF type:complete len:111 (-),score=23.16 TRINITY_DN9105_c0_g1_i5:396-728(-)